MRSGGRAGEYLSGDEKDETGRPRYHPTRLRSRPFKLSQGGCIIPILTTRSVHWILFLFNQDITFTLFIYTVPTLVSDRAKTFPLPLRPVPVLAEGFPHSCDLNGEGDVKTQPYALRPTPYALHATKETTIIRASESTLFVGRGFLPVRRDGRQGEAETIENHHADEHGQAGPRGAVPCHGAAGVERQRVLELLPGKSPFLSARHDNFFPFLPPPPGFVRGVFVFRYVCFLTGANESTFFFLQKGRREIFDYIYDEIPDKDWQNPANSHAVEQRYVDLAYERWGGTQDAWVLDGDWMVARPDILSWMRSIYWKHNKPRRLRMREGAVHPIFFFSAPLAGL